MKTITTILSIFTISAASYGDILVNAYDATGFIPEAAKNVASNSNPETDGILKSNYVFCGSFPSSQLDPKCFKTSLPRKDSTMFFLPNGAVGGLNFKSAGPGPANVNYLKMVIKGPGQYQAFNGDVSLCANYTAIIYSGVGSDHKKPKFFAFVLEKAEQGAAANP